MTPQIYILAAAMAVSAALGGAGAWKAQDTRWTAKTLQEKNDRDTAERLAKDAQDTDARQQRKFNDTAAGQHAADLAAINTQLGDARGKLSKLSGRQCFDGATVRLLNSIGTPASGIRLRASTGQFAGAPQAAAGPSADDSPEGYATERDTAQWIATCRAQYSEVAGQVNQILDIEDWREAGAAAKPQPK